MNKVFIILLISLVKTSHTTDIFSSIMNLGEKVLDGVTSIYKHGKEVGKLEAAVEIAKSAPNAGNAMIEATSIPITSAGADIAAAVAATASSANEIGNITNELKSSAIIISDSIEKAGSTIGDPLEKIGSAAEKAGTAMEAFKWIGAIGSGIYIAKSGYDLCSWSRKTFFPTEKEIAEEERVILELKKFRAERDLNLCLVNNALCKKNKDGLPNECEITAQIFTQVAGLKAYNEIKDEYRKYLGEQK